MTKRISYNGKKGIYAAGVLHGKRLQKFLSKLSKKERKEICK